MGTQQQTWSRARRKEVPASTFPECSARHSRSGLALLVCLFCQVLSGSTIPVDKGLFVSRGVAVKRGKHMTTVSAVSVPLPF